MLRQLWSLTISLLAIGAGVHAQVSVYEVVPESAARQDRAWIEPIEKYQVPCDPWLPALDRGFDWSPEARMFRATAAEYAKRSASAGKTAEQRERNRSSLQRWIQSRESSVTKQFSIQHPVTIIRAWDGIAQREIYFSMGEGQSQVEKRLVVGRVYEIVWDLGRPYDDLQGIRVTVQSAEEAKPIPSEFARWAEVEHRFQPRRFGEAAARSPQPALVLVAEKVGGVGDGLYRFRIPWAQSALGRDFPWFCEYEVYQLDANGARSALATTSARASGVYAPLARGGAMRDRSYEPEGQFRVERPSPWGYQVEITHWFGVVAVPAPAGPPLGQQPSSPAVPVPPKVPGGLAPPLPGSPPKPEEPLRPAAPPIPDPEPIQPQP